MADPEWRAQSGSRGSFGGARGGRGRGRGGAGPTPPAKRHKSGAVALRKKKLPEPIYEVVDRLYDERYVEDLWSASGGVGAPKAVWTNNPKSIVGNYHKALTGRTPTFEHIEVQVEGVGGTYKRVTVVVDEANGITGIGDARTLKEAERLASLSACYQLGARRLFSNTNQPIGQTTAKPAAPADPTPSDSRKLSDGSDVTLERARAFMEFYCKRFNFGKPDLVYSNRTQGATAKQRRKRGSSEAEQWEASLVVGDRKIGVGQGRTKKVASNDAFLDTAVYLEACDPELWRSYISAEAAGKTRDTAVPDVLFQLSNDLDEDLRDAVYAARGSDLYRRAQVMMNRDRRKAHLDEATEAAPIKYVGPPQLSQARKAFLERKSQQLANRLSSYQVDDSPKVKALRAQRLSLPVTSQKSLVLAAIEKNPVTILQAATGSGKTTQVPQLILDSMIMRGQGAKCNIICTQPRRIAAISVAQRVANERNEEVGESIGYQVRFEARPPKADGSVLFCTTGVFLRRLQNELESMDGQFLDPITHIVVDEVHERDIDTDLLLFCLRKVLQDRKAKGKPEIKVLLMSATVDPMLFQTYFTDPVSGKLAPVVSVPGRSFPVEKHFIERVAKELRERRLAPSDGGWVFEDPKVAKYLQRELHEVIEVNPDTGKVIRDNDELDMPYALVALTVAHVLRKSDDGHVLVFLPGWDEIKGVNEVLLGQPLLGLPLRDGSQYEIHLLHSTIPVADQQKVFSPPPPGVRRIILSTNIAETSVTIPDVVYVVDTGKIKEKRFDPARHLSALVTAWVGTSNLNQRAGRAGRHRPGEYYGLLSERRYDALHSHSTVEMKRTDLSNLAMHVKALNFPGMEAEDVLAATIEPPESERVAAAMAHLQTIGALDKYKRLTAMGRVILQLPVEAQIGKLCLLGSFFRCLEPTLNLAAILTNRDPFLSPITAREEANAVKSSWASLSFRSDPLAALKAFTEWWEIQKRGDYGRATRFAIDNFLSRPTLMQIAQVREHLLSSLDRAGVLAVSAGGSAAPLNLPRRRFGGPSRASDIEVPAELNTNAGSESLLAALIAVAVAPNFAVRKSKRLMATHMDRSCVINNTSVNSHNKSKDEDIPLQNERQLFAFGEKSLALPRPGEKGKGQMSLRSTTRIDPLGYMLFGARKLEVSSRGLQCDDWLPIVGRVDALDDVERLKEVLDASLLRVFDGLQAQIIAKQVIRSRGYRPPIETERDDTDEKEDDAEDADLRDLEADAPLTDQEVADLDMLTRDVVLLLNRYSEERLALDASRNASRPESRQDTYPGGPSGRSDPFGRMMAVAQRSGASGPSSSRGGSGNVTPSSWRMGSRTTSAQGWYGR